MTRPTLLFDRGDWRVGAYYDSVGRRLYICPIPMVVIYLDMSSLCWWRRHAWSGWTECLDRGAIGCRYRQCARCLKVETGA